MVHWSICRSTCFVRFDWRLISHWHWPLRTSTKKVFAIWYFLEEILIFILALEFCDSCVVLDPVHPTSWQTSTVFETGCESKRCIADLNVQLTVDPGYAFLLVVTLWRIKRDFVFVPGINPSFLVQIGRWRLPAPLRTPEKRHLWLNCTLIFRDCWQCRQCVGTNKMRKNFKVRVSKNSMSLFATLPVTT